MGWATAGATGEVTGGATAGATGEVTTEVTGAARFAGAVDTILPCP